MNADVHETEFYPQPTATEREAEQALGAGDAYQLASGQMYTAVSALENYGDHHEWCALSTWHQANAEGTNLAPQPGCSCGFDTEVDRLRQVAEAWSARVGFPA